jgi:hypothetical protein
MIDFFTMMDQNGLNGFKSTKMVDLRYKNKIISRLKFFSSLVLVMLCDSN